MSDKNLSIYFAIFAVLYFVYIFFVVGHGVHWTNSILTVTAIYLAIYFYLKSRKKN